MKALLLAHWRTSAAALTALAVAEAQLHYGPAWLAQVAGIVSALGIAAGFLSAADAARVEAVAEQLKPTPPAEG